MRADRQSRAGHRISRLRSEVKVFVPRAELFRSPHISTGFESDRTLYPNLNDGCELGEASSLMPGISVRTIEKPQTPPLVGETCGTGWEMARRRCPTRRM